MNNRLAGISLLVSLGIVVPSLSSCVKENEGPMVFGTWAQVDENMMTTHIVSFVSGTYTSSVSTEPFLVAEKEVWNCLEKDFRSVINVSYSVSDGIICTSKGNLDATVEGETMTLNGDSYVLINSFRKEYYREIELKNNKVECDFAGANLNVPFQLHNFGTLCPVASSDADWITSIVCSENSIAFTVKPTTVSREAVIKLSYFGAGEESLTVSQQANREITSNPEIVYANYAEQVKSVTVAVTNGLPGSAFSATSEANWIEDINVSGNTISFKILENNTGSNRNATLVVSYEGADDLVIPINQEYSAAAVNISQTSFDLSPDSGSYTTSYIVDYPRLATELLCYSYPDWVSGVTITNDKISFTVNANITTGDRSGEIRFYYGALAATISIKQNYATFSVSPSSWAASYAGATRSVTVTSNIAWDVSCDRDWLSVEKSSVSGNKTTLILTAALNNSGASRTGHCYVTSEKSQRTITITQGTTSLDVSPGSWTTGYGASSTSVSISTTGNWVLTSDQPWLTPQLWGGSDSGSVNLYVAPNVEKGATERTATVSVENTTYNLRSTVSVTQGAFSPSLSVNKSSISTSYGSYSSSATVTSNIPWTASSSASWVTVSPYVQAVSDYQSASTALTINVESNSTSMPRTATITVASEYYGLSRVITVSQMAATSAMITVPISYTVTSPESGSFLLPIQSNTSWNVKKSDADWLTLLSTSGSGNEDFIVVVAANNTGSDRTATLTVYNVDYNLYKTVEVVQKKASLSISPSSWGASTSGETSTQLSITSNCSWTATSNVSWITLSNNSGKGNGQITVSLQENPNNADRSGTVTVSNTALGCVEQLPITQPAAFALSTSISSWSPNCGKQSSSVTVTTNGNWVASSNASWLTINKSSGSSGSTSLTMSVTGNVSTSSRTAKVTISNPTYSVSKTISVTQYGYTQGGITLTNKVLDLGITLDRTSTYTLIIKGWTSNGTSLFGLGLTTDSNDWRFFKSGNNYYFDWGSNRFYYSYSTSITGSYRKFVLSNYALKYYASESATSTTWSKSGSTQSSVPSTTATLKLGNASETLTFKNLIVTNSSGTTTHNFIGVNTNGTVGVFDTVTGSLIVGGTFVSL